MSTRITIGPPGTKLDWDNWGKPVTDLLNEFDGRIASLETILTTWNVSTSAGGTGVTTTETKDASGDLAFVAVEGFTYTVTYTATVLTGAANHVVDVNIRDGGASSPTNASTIRATTAVLGYTASTIRLGFTLTKPLVCPTDIAAGTHTLAVFYVRNPNGATTSVVQLENAGPNRRLSVVGSRNSV